MLGTIHSALVLGHARGTHMGEYISNPLEAKGICDEWFVDDGQVFVLPWSFDPRHRALDASLLWGATRGCVAHGNVKRSARMSEFVAWDTLYVQDAVTVLSSDSGTTALGFTFVSREHINAQAWESVRACDEMRCAIVCVDHAPTEMVLTRQCADVFKLMYHRRINGDMLDHDLLTAFDFQLRASVSASLCNDLPDHSWWQATGVTCGGLGLRTALRVALTAFVASRIMWSPSWSTTSALPLASRASRSWPSTTRALTTLLRASTLGQLDEALNGCSSGATFMTADDGDGDDEHPWQASA